MPAFMGKYEMEVRLGLVFIVALLLLLNISTAYVLQNVKRQLTDEVDNRLASSVSYARQYLAKNQLPEMTEDQIAIICRRFGITGIGAKPMLKSDLDTLSSHLNVAISENVYIPALEKGDLERLHAGDILFRCGEEAGIRYGLTLAQLTPAGKLLIYAQADSGVMETIGQAAEMTLYLAVAVVVMIIPIVIGLPRQILKPFRKMSETARSAGKLISSKDSDEVAAVIKSYESVIDELKKNEAELARLYRESSTRADRLEKLNRYILKSIGSGVINVDLTGRVIGYNRAAMEILGHDEKSVLGKHYLVAFPQEMELGLLIEAGLERDEISGRKEIELKRPDETALWLGVETSIIIDDNEHVVGVTLLINDLTEIRNMQSELEMNRRLAALGEMTGGLAHQLRNSLATISGFSQLLQKKIGRESNIGEIAESIRTEAAASETMVSRFLTFAKPLSLSVELFDIKSLTEECLTKFSTDTSNLGISLNSNLPDTEINILGDPLLLKEAICNVITNAVEAAGKNGEVDVTVESTGSRTNIFIADNGPGIPESIKDKFFTPFVSSKPSGTGLGLALAQKIINLHKGAISFDSNRDRGTVCRISLPGKISDTSQQPISAADAKKQ